MLEPSIMASKIPRYCQKYTYKDNPKCRKIYHSQTLQSIISLLEIALVTYYLYKLKVVFKLFSIISKSLEELQTDVRKSSNI